jgi:thiamine-monophosphate kinase
MRKAQSNSPASGPRKPNLDKPNLGELDLGEIDPGETGLGETDLIRQIRRRAGSRPGSGIRLGIGDDCALLRLRPGEELALTTDLSIAGRHFELGLHPPESIGHRALARGLSDLAAMGARPVAAFLSLGVPRQLTGSWLTRFLDGFLSLAARHKTPLAGGDLAESPHPVADIVLTGAVPRGKALLRSGARAGDLIYVTGTLGGSAAGLAQLKQVARSRTLTRANRRSGSSSAQPQPLRIPAAFPPANFAALAPHLYPEPRIAQGLFLLRHSKATAAIDLSDGLSTDLAHLCAESGVAAEIDAAMLPIHSALTPPAATLEQALHGGEDYELLFTAPPSARVPRRIAGVSATRIGRISRARASSPPVTLLTANGSQPLAPRGWQHFS